MHAKCANNKNKSSPLQFTAVPNTTRSQTNKNVLVIRFKRMTVRQGRHGRKGRQGMAEQGKAPSTDGAGRLPKLPCGAICFVAFGNV